MTNLTALINMTLLFQIHLRGTLIIMNPLTCRVNEESGLRL